ncbi:MAG: alpha/beta hydrolase [Firmicutes bacterium]|nr:alpha/beta hydrolase [Bacillota bacterium]
MEEKHWSRKMIVNRRGLKLAALFRAAEPGRGAERGGRAPLVIVCHGFTGSKEGGGGAVAMADELAGRGFAALLFDFTGCGESEGLWEEITLSREVEDLGAVVDWARSKGYRRIILNGRSFGGATVLAYAAADEKIAAVCTWAAVARPLRLFGDLARGRVNLDGPDSETISLFDDSGTLGLRRRFFQDLQRYDLPGCAAKISPRPLLLIHGTADEVVPVEEAHLLYGRAGEPKELSLIEGADHRFSDHAGGIWAVFFRWLGELQ